MAEQKESIPNSFSIEDTMTLGGAGSAELLQGLFAPETSTASPDEIKDINEPVVKKKVEKTTVSTETTKKEEPLEKSLADQLVEEEEEKGEELLKGKKKLVENVEEFEEADDNKFSALAKDLFKLNVFTKEEGEPDIDIKSPEEFLERFQIEKKKGSIEIVNNFIGQHGEAYQDAFEAIFVNGVDPKEYFTTYNNIENIAGMDLSIEANQEAVVRKHLQDQGLDQAKITAKLDKIKSYGDLEDEAKTYHEILVKKESAKLAQIEEESSQRLQQLATVKQQFAKNVQSVLQEKLKTKEFDGIPINPKLALELQDFLITDRYKTSSGETLTEFDKTILELKRPENHIKKAKLGLLLKLLEVDPTLSTIQKTGVTKQANTLFSSVTKATSKTQKTEEKPKSWFTPA